MRGLPRRVRGSCIATFGACLLLLSGGCSGADSASSDRLAGHLDLRLGYFPNLTHATAIVGLEEGLFAEHLGSRVVLNPSPFAAGPAAVEALFAEAIDATFIGPNPAVNAYAKSGGEAVRIVSGAASGGAFLVVKPSVRTPADLPGKRLATPQLGNTQDVALRTWLASQGLKTDLQGGGDVSVVPQENAQTLEAFRAGAIDGAWVPEPWATRLVLEAAGKVLVDESTLWPNGRFVTTHLVVRGEFLEAHPDVVGQLLEGVVAATDFVNDRPEEAKQIVNDAIGKLTGKVLPDDVIARAWSHLVFTYDPIASSLREAARRATKLALLEPVDLNGIYDLALLNEILQAAGQETVKT